jgi:toxin ParE1/3/4
MPILWRPTALLGLEAARDYIATSNPAAAKQIHEAILSAVGCLADFPHLGRAGGVSGTRELVVPGTPFVVAYAASDGDIDIIAILHGARKWPASL